MQDATFLTVLYKKYFNSKSAADRFINRHKRRDCYELAPNSWDMWRGWTVTKTRPATPAEIERLFAGIKH